MTDSESHVDELVELVGDHAVARAAFDEAVRRPPGRIVTLRRTAEVSPVLRRTHR
jgi:hypothetical protein